VIGVRFAAAALAVVCLGAACDVVAPDGSGAFYYYQGGKIRLIPVNGALSGWLVAPADTATLVDLARAAGLPAPRVNVMTRSRYLFTIDYQTPVTRAQFADYAARLARSPRVLRVFQAYRTEGGGPLWLTGEILAAGGSAASDLRIEEFARLEHLEVPQRPDSVVHPWWMLTVTGVDQDPITEANRLYELGFVEWSEPNFLGEISGWP
jgi:hypothetical protein